MLEVRELHISYGKVRAVQGVSFAVAADQIVALIGANGAGKSSILRAISGIEKAARGDIRFEGRPIVGLPAHAIAAQGIVQVPEGRMIFANLSVRENLRLGAYNRRDADAGIAEVLDIFPVLRERLDEPGSALSGGQAQILALARGVIARPRLLLLDEPVLGLSPKAAHEIFGLIGTLRDRGITIVLVEQNLRQALAIADWAHVVESGQIVLEGNGAELTANRYLIDAYIGMAREEIR